MYQSWTAEQADLAHVLSHCQAVLKHGRHNSRYDCVLGILHQHVQQNLPKGAVAVVNLADRPYELRNS